MVVLDPVCVYSVHAAAPTRISIATDDAAAAENLLLLLLLDPPPKKKKA